MHVTEFLNSSSYRRRSRFFQHDTAIRALRAQGASYQAVANYLKLHGVTTTRQAVHDYLQRYPAPPRPAEQTRTAIEQPPAVED
jgi:hypothetical protein